MGFSSHCSAERETIDDRVQAEADGESQPVQRAPCCRHMTRLMRVIAVGSMHVRRASHR